MRDNKGLAILPHLPTSLTAIWLWVLLAPVLARLSQPPPAPVTQRQAPHTGTAAGPLSRGAGGGPGLQLTSKKTQMDSPQTS